MKEFFHGWRRKAGVVSLVMALALFVVWMRSYFILDGLLIPNRQFQYGLISCNGGFRWELCDPVPIANRLIAREWISGPVTEAHRVAHWSKLNVGWRRNGYGFDFGTATDNPTNVRFDFAVIPYWSIVLPLTLLSAYLILWKPRKRPSPN